jgi:hypothetical protein
MVEEVDRKQREGIQEEARARYSRECPRDYFLQEGPTSSLLSTSNDTIKL